jgi:pimeloyl-ACP methyl ester carboxylesterase
LIRADAALGTTLNDAAWEQAKQYLPAHSRAVQVDGATHNVHRSKFDAFLLAVNDFLSQ